MEHLAVAENLLREEVVDAAVRVLVADGGQRVLLPGEGVLGVVVDHRAAVQHRREDALAVAVVVQLVQLGVDEDRQAAHREQLLGFEQKRGKPTSRSFSESEAEYWSFCENRSVVRRKVSAPHHHTV